MTGGPRPSSRRLLGLLRPDATDAEIEQFVEEITRRANDPAAPPYLDHMRPPDEPETPA